jgi:hypothetical protein
LECSNVLLRQFHEKPVTAAPTPPIALNAADKPFAVVVDLNERSLAAVAVARVFHRNKLSPDHLGLRARLPPLRLR